MIHKYPPLMLWDPNVSDIWIRLGLVIYGDGKGRMGGGCYHMPLMVIGVYRGFCRNLASLDLLTSTIIFTQTSNRCLRANSVADPPITRQKYYRSKL